MWLRSAGSGGFLYGRFGFDEDRKAAQSFLMFSGDAHFTELSFSGLTKKLQETGRELYERRVREKHEFAGFEMIRFLTQPNGSGMSAPLGPPTPVSKQLGPYDPQHHILKEQDIEALRLCPVPKPKPSPGEFVQATGKECGVDGFLDHWKKPVFDLLNEMVLSYLERHFVSTAVGGALANPKKLFPKREYSHYFDAKALQLFKQPGLKPIPNFDTKAVSARIKAFMDNRSQQQLRANDKEIAGICRVVALS